MIVLMLILHIFIGCTLAGSAVVAALTMGYGSVSAILVAAAFGFVVAFPVSWAVAKKLSA